MVPRYRYHCMPVFKNDQICHLGGYPPGPLHILADPPVLVVPGLVRLPDDGHYRLLRQVLLLLLLIKSNCIVF